MKKTFILTVIAAVCLFSGCMDSDCPNGICTENYGVNPDLTVTRAPLEAICEINVKDMGVKNMESDYLPNVVWCENGMGSSESLKAQAVAARSVAYYTIKESGSATNGESNQVYNCPSYAPSTANLATMQEAVNATSGVVLTYGGVVICSFYVSGSTSLDNNCVYIGDSSSGPWPQPAVTYNEGNRGDQVKKSSLGLDVLENRGCMSQNGANCLAKNRGYKWPEILKFFYGDDIGYRQLAGSCVTPVSFDGNDLVKCDLNKSGVIIDEKDSCFVRTVSSTWFEGKENVGYNKHYYYTYAGADYEEVVGTWNLKVTRPGKYTVYAHYPKDVGAVSTQAPYTIRATGVEHKVKIDMTGKDGWVKLGDFEFASGEDQWVRLSDLTGEKYTDPSGKRIIFDAIKFEDVVTCTNACTEGEKACEGTGFKECKKGKDGCTAWSAVQPCPEGQACSGNACVDTCKPECNVENLRECSENGFRVCTSVDGCLKWGDVVACDNGCDNGACKDPAPTCEDECTADTRECLDEAGSYRMCGQFDDDSCREWSQPALCGDGQICSNGECVDNGEPGVECTDKCETGAVVCDGNGYKTCGDFNADGCSEWSEVTACKADETCDDGVCKAAEEPASHDVVCLTEIDGRPSTIIDETDDCFERSETGNWQAISQYGYNHSLYYAYLMDQETVGTWHFNVTKAGKYDIYVYVDTGIGGVPDELSYELKTSNRVYFPSVQTKNASGWVLVDTYELSEGKDQYIRLSNKIEGSDDNQKRVIYDAVKIVPEGSEDGTSDGENSSVSSSSSSDCSSNGTMNTTGMGGLAAILAALGSVGMLRRRRGEMYE